jgi:hypothetical protein
MNLERLWDLLRGKIPDEKEVVPVEGFCVNPLRSAPIRVRQLQLLSAPIQRHIRG